MNWKKVQAETAGNRDKSGHWRCPHHFVAGELSLVNAWYLLIPAPTSALCGRCELWIGILQRENKVLKWDWIGSELAQKYTRITKLYFLNRRTDFRSGRNTVLYDMRPDRISVGAHSDQVFLVLLLPWCNGYLTLLLFSQLMKLFLSCGRHWFTHVVGSNLEWCVLRLNLIGCL